MENNKIKKPLKYFYKIIVVFALLVVTAAAFIATFQHLEPNENNIENVSSNSVIQNNSSKPKVSSALPLRANKVPELVLVNYNNKMPDDFKQNIVEKNNIYMDERIVQPLEKMQKDARKENLNIWVSSGYRSVQRQKQLYEREIEAFNKTGLEYSDAVDKASKSVAKPGYSEHNTGLAIDLNGVLDSFNQTKEYQWLQLHAEEYGFILRYPKDKQDITKIKFEPWHYRYVGAEHAKKMKELNMCLEEYVCYLNQNQEVSH